MIYLIFGLVALILISVICFYFGDDWDNTFIWCMGATSSIVALITAVGIIFVGYSYVAAGHKAKIINKEFDKNYTTEQVFYAEDIIDEIRQIKRNRYEINGDLMRGVK